MEEDIKNYSPIVMFRGTPCISSRQRAVLNKRFKAKKMRTGGERNRGKNAVLLISVSILCIKEKGRRFEDYSEQLC